MATACLSAVPSGAEPIRLRPSPVPKGTLAEAIGQLGKGNLKRADALFRQVLKDDPSQVYALLGQAQVAVSDRRIAEADRSVSAVLLSHDNLPEAHNMKGVVLLLQKRPDEARQHFTRAIDLQPKYVTPRIYLAAMARSQGNYQLASKEYAALAEVAPGLPAGHIGQAEAQMMLRNVPEAFRILEAWKGVPGSGVAPYQVLANVHLARKDPQKALGELKAALGKAPDDPLTLMYLGDAYAVSGDSRAAIQQYEAVLKVDPGNLGAALRLGDQWHASGQSAKALDCYRQALAIDPKHPVANNNIAWLLAEAGGQLDEALRLATTAITTDPTYADAFDTIGWIRFRRGEYAKAIESLQRAKKLAGPRPDIAGRLGLAYAKAGKKEQALAELRLALAGGSAVSNRAELQRVADELSGQGRP